MQCGINEQNISSFLVALPEEEADDARAVL